MAESLVREFKTRNPCKIAEALGVEMWELFTEKPTSNEPNSNTLVCPKCGAEFVLKENT